MQPKPLPRSAWALAADALDPPDDRHPFALLGYAPHPKQQLFHDATEFDVLYGGAAGGGKSKALVMHTLWAAATYPGIVIIILRRTFPELQKNIVAELRKVNFAAALGARYNATEHVLTFTNGSVIYLQYMERLDDATRLQGTSELQLIAVDERTQMPPGGIEYVMSRLRTASPRIPVLGVRSTSNPGGASHSAVKARYIHPTSHGEKVVTDDHGYTIRFIPARVEDNPSIDADYANKLAAIPDPALRAALLDGSWDSFEGQVFDEWRHDRHVCDPFRIPQEWERIAGIDYGYRAPWVCLWGAVDQDGRGWIYRELSGTQIGETAQARMILDAEREDGDPSVIRYADPAMWNKTGQHDSVAEMYESEGCAIDKATNDRLSGWQRVHTWLAEAPACQMHRAAGWETCPRLHVFRNCLSLIETLPAMPYSRTRVEDVDTTSDDHASDALRYLLMGIGGGARMYVPSAGTAERVHGDGQRYRDFGPFAMPTDQMAPWLRG